MASRIQGDLFVDGAFGAGQMVIPAGAVTNTAVSAYAKIGAAKLEHQHRLMYAQPNTTATAETKVVYHCYGASGTSVAFYAGCIGVCTGNATISVDLKKNGTSILTSPVVLNSSDTARVAKSGTIASSGLAAGDVLEVSVSVNAGSGTLGTGVFAAVTVHEDAQ